ncbi:MAG TPA: FtsW/RodA/SpoVE family cell cycle protein [Gemmatimonadales bacterium]|nr:FtsW/RodA/SpoVE family cell cycle protein [Gemmatimonadales bacterium]
MGGGARREFVLGWEARLLVVITAVLVVFGLAAVYSASSVLVEGGKQLGSARVQDQLLGVGIGVVLFLIASRINLDRLRELAWPLIGLTAVMLLILVLPFTHSIAPRQFGARRWLDLGVSIQVSELAKLAIVVWVAMLCAKKGKDVRRLSRGALPVFVVVGPLAALMLMQPDLSVAVQVTFIAAIVLFAAGARIGHFIVLGALAVPILWSHISKVQYQLLRLIAFADPGAARPAERYQLEQSLIGVGSGQLLGVGFGNGQQKLGFLPLPYSDFIFATIAEEWGFVGVVAIVGLYLTFVLVALRLARAAADPFRQYLGIGCAALIGGDAFLHIAVSLGIAPNTGLVLPFISHGRSALLVAFVVTGLIVNLGTKRREKI